MSEDNRISLSEDVINLYAEIFYKRWGVEFETHGVLIKLWVRDDGDIDTEYYFESDVVWVDPSKEEWTQPSGYVLDEDFNIAWISMGDEWSLKEAHTRINDAIDYINEECFAKQKT